jgi:ubiquinone/menaquinone biosynthesis C-methylase UbiE
VTIAARARLAREYSDKAAVYAHRWAPVLRPMSMSLVERLRIAMAHLVIDVGAGTGSLLPALASAAPHARIVGVDPAEGMLRVAKRAWPQPLVAMDAQHLAFRSGIADAAILSFVLFHIPEPIVALREIRRVLRPRGIVGTVTWGADSSTPGLGIWTEELDAHGAQPDPRDPSVAQLARFDSEAKMHDALSAAGYSAVDAWRQTFEHRWTVDTLVAVQSACGLPARRLASLSPEQAAVCEMRVRTRLMQLPKDALIHHADVIFAVASAEERGRT